MLYIARPGVGYLKGGEKRYFLEVFGAALLFMAVGWLRRTTSQSIADPTLLLTVNLLPLLPIALMALALWRYYGHSDELQRQIILNTSGAGALLAFTVFLAWPVLARIGLPSLTVKAALLVLGVSFMLCGLIISFLHHRAVSGFRGAAVQMVPTLSLLAMILAVFAALHGLLPAHTAPSLWSLLGMGGVAIAYAIYRSLKARLDP
jgi:hypothetical protein